MYDLLFVCSVKFFAFDFAHFKFIREWVKNFELKLLNKLLKCPFCQGFWCGLATHSIKYNESLINHLYFAFVTAIICLCWNVVFWPLIDKYEETYKE